MDSEFTGLLRGLNLKDTPKRRAILRILSRESVYVSPEDVWRRMKREFSQIGLPTVYRNLEELSERGALTKIIHPNRQLYYYFCPNTGHHHHFICVSCQRVEDLKVCVLEELQEEIGDAIGGTVLSHIVQVNGLCGPCSAAQTGSLKGSAA